MTELDATRAPGDRTAAQVYHYTATGTVATAPGDGLDLIGHDGSPLDTAVTQAEWTAAGAPGAVHNCALLPAGAYLLHVGFQVAATDRAYIKETDYAYAGVIEAAAVLRGGWGEFAMIIASTPVRVYAAARIDTDAARAFSADVWCVRIG